MFDSLFRMNDADLFCLLGTIFILGSIACVIIIRHIIPLDMRYKDNPVIGNVGSLISLIYGVLVGITALYLINNLSATQDAVQREANATANLYRESKLLKEPNRSEIETDIKKYLNEVINIEWPAMQAGQNVDHQGNFIIENLSNVLLNYQSSSYTNGELMVLRDMLDETKSLYDARQTRIVESETELSVELWEVILIGTLLVLGINFIFGVHLFFHLFTISCASLMASSMIFLLITMDRPFQGEFAVDSGPFQEVKNFIGDEETHPWLLGDNVKNPENKNLATPDKSVTKVRTP